MINASALTYTTSPSPLAGVGDYTVAVAGASLKTPNANAPINGQVG
jgi:hypothetical protein